MQGEARRAPVAEIATTIASASGALAALQAALWQLAVCYDVSVDLWGRAAGKSPGELRYLAGNRVSRDEPQPPRWEAALVEAATAQRTVVSEGIATTATAIPPVALAIPVLTFGQLQGVLLVRARQPASSLLAQQSALEDLAPTFGLLLHTLALDTALQAGTTVDTLTGLANRRYLSEALDREIARARRTRRLLALLLVGIDRFEAVQVEWGPAIGDHALQTMAKALCADCRNDDLIGRYGLDQFLALLPDTNGQGARIFANRLLSQLEHYPVSLPQGGTYYLNASIGIALFPVDGLTGDELVENAAIALSEAQRRGGGRTVAA